MSLIIIYSPTRTRRNKPLVDRPPRTPRISLQSFSQKPPEFAFLLSGNILCRNVLSGNLVQGPRNSAVSPLFITLFDTNSDGKRTLFGIFNPIIQRVLTIMYTFWGLKWARTLFHAKTVGSFGIKLFCTAFFFFFSFFFP